MAKGVQREAAGFMRSRKDVEALDWETFSGRCEPTREIPIVFRKPVPASIQPNLNLIYIINFWYK